MKEHFYGLSDIQVDYLLEALHNFQIHGQSPSIRNMIDVLETAQEDEYLVSFHMYKN